MSRLVVNTLLASLLLLLLLLLSRCGPSAARLDGPEVVMDRVKHFAQVVQDRIAEVDKDPSSWQCDCVYHGCQEHFKGPITCMDTNGQPEQNTCMRENVECAPMKVFTNYSIVRTSPDVHMQKLARPTKQGLESDVVQDICLFQGLEDDYVFQNASEWDETSFPGWRYLGTGSGVFIRWPGSPRKKTGQDFDKECLRYDPRIRPWYVPALGNRKATAILLDIKDLEIGNPLVRTLLGTFSHGDHVTVVPFDSAGLDDREKIEDLFLVTATNEWRSDVLSRLIDRKPPGLSASVRFAVSQLRNTTFESKDKILMYISGGSVSSGLGNKILNYLDSQQDPEDPISVLTFSLERNGLNTMDTDFAKTLSCEHYGVWTPVPDPKQPDLQAYLSFVALPIEHAPSIPSHVHVSEIYKDTSGLGWVVTVSCPVLEYCGDKSERKLRGVVGVDKQLGLLKNAGILEEYVQKQIADTSQIRLRNVPNLQCQLQRIRAQTNSECKSSGPACKNKCTRKTIPLQSGSQILCNYDPASGGSDFVDSDVCCPESENNKICAVKHEHGQDDWLMISVIFIALVIVATGSWPTLLLYKYCKHRRESSRAIIGRGASGYVTRGLYKGKQVAMKVFTENTVEARREINTLTRIPEHQNIVRMIHKEACIGKDGKIKTLTLYLELMEMNLKEFIKNPKLTRDLSYSVLLQMLADVVEGLKHLHKFGIAHRDIKPENILIKIDGPNILVKICDMGHSKLHLQSSSISAVRGTRGYIPPEIMARAYTSDDLKFGPACDVYSLGITMTYCILADAAFETEKGKMPDPLQRLISDCTNVVASGRPTLASVYADLVHFQTCSWAHDLVYPSE